MAGRPPDGGRVRGDPIEERAETVGSEMRKVVVTGLGVVSPLGNDTESFWKALTAGCSGAGPITRFDTTGYDVRFACEVKNFTVDGVLERKEAKRMDRFVEFAMVAADQAVRHAGLDGDGVD